jgi:regulator of sigma E protease
MLTTFLAAFIVLASVIVFHEFGHFIVAKLAGIYVKTFSVGFGPKLLKVRFGETQYALSAVPLGGYVRMAGEASEEPPPATEATAPDAAEPRRIGEAMLQPRDDIADGDIPPHRYFRNKPIATRLAVVTAGPIANLVLAIVVMTGVLFHEGEAVAPTTTLAGIDAASDEARAGLRDGDVLLEIAGRPVTNSKEIATALLASDAPALQLQLRRDGRDTTLALPPVRRDGDRIEFPVWGYRLEARVGAVKKDGPAARAGLLPGDRITSVGGKPVRFHDELADIVNPAIGQELEITWERDGRTLQGKVIPEPEEVPVDDSLTETRQVGRIQIEPARLVLPVGLGRAFIESLHRTWQFIADTGRFLGSLMRGKGSADSVGGPIRIGQVAGSALRWGFSTLFYFMAFFSVNLFLLNMLPIPVLDGGHVLFLAIEAIRGEALSARVQELALKVGVSALIALMGYVVLMDLKRVITG